jgi:NADPH-dependent 2,4-dienoyl-CoA reductase/sulfur reductase-like enzyme/nitrite reductase/ring-hydroxylating ferredoxin subunit
MAKELSGPNFTDGLAMDAIPDGGMVKGHDGNEEIIMARRGNEYFALGANCTHYGGPLAEGIIVDDTVRCPWHHACFSLGTGGALRPPALDPIGIWKIETRDGKVYVRERESEPPKHKPARKSRENVIIIGGGAAGNAAAVTLREEGYDGEVTIISADDHNPYDRPSLSKDFLEGAVNEEKLPLLPANFYNDNAVELLLNSHVSAIDCKSKTIQLDRGERRNFDALLIATGAEPIALDAAAASRPNVRYLRSWNDCRAILSLAEKAKTAVIVGASFIAMEVAASLAQRNLKVHIVAPEDIPMAKILGPEVGTFLRHLHESKGVSFHLGETVAAVEEAEVILSNGKRIPCDFVVVGIGVRPRTELAERAGIKIDNGIAVNEHLETSVRGIFAAGDIARWPDPHSGEKIRVEHWVVAERQGQTAARNILGRGEKFDAVPFFWTRQFDFTIHYNGHAEKWDRIDIDGSLKDYDCTLAFVRSVKRLATATVGRDDQSLQLEVSMERSVPIAD